MPPASSLLNWSSSLWGKANRTIWFQNLTQQVICTYHAHTFAVCAVNSGLSLLSLLVTWIGFKINQKRFWSLIIKQFLAQCKFPLCSMACHAHILRTQESCSLHVTTYSLIIQCRNEWVSGGKQFTPSLIRNKPLKSGYGEKGVTSSFFLLINTSRQKAFVSHFAFQFHC